MKTVGDGTDTARSYADETPEGFDVSTVVAGAIDGRFENERAASEPRMIQNAAKRIAADLAFADVLVTIKMRAEGGFGIVRVNDMDARETHGSLDFGKRAFETFGCAQIMTGGEKMRGIDANTEREFETLVDDALDFGEARADGSSLPGCVFQQDTQISKIHAARGLPQSVGDGGDRRGHRSAFAAAGMRHQEIGAESDGANDFFMKGLDRTDAKNAIRRSEIDQIIVVNDERAKLQFLTASTEAKRGGTDALRAIRGTTPHTRTGGKNLERVGAEIVGKVERGSNFAGDGRVDANANAAVHPRRRSRLGNRFGTIFITGEIRLR